MDIGMLELSKAAWLCLGKLAMAVELEGGERFAFRKSLEELVCLVLVAEASVNAETRRRKAEFFQALSPATQRLLAGCCGKAEPAEEGAAVGAPATAQYYRGVRVGAERDAEPESVAGGAAPNGAPAAQYYRGVRVGAGDEPADAAPEAKDAAVDAQGRRRIVYRGKVMYI